MALEVSNTGNLDANSRIKVGQPTDPAQAGFSMISGSLGELTDPAGLVPQKIRTSTQGRLATGQPVPLLNEFFSATAINTAVFSTPVTTGTITLGSGVVTLNGAPPSAVTGVVTRLTTYAYYPLFADLALYGTCRAMLTQTPQVNNVVEIGFFQATGSTAPTDGVFFRWDAAGDFKAVMNTNGTEMTSSALTAPTANVMHKFKIVIENDRSLFYVDGALQAVIAAPSGLGAPIYQSSCPWNARLYNSGTVGTAQQLKIAYLYVAIDDAAGLNKSNEVLAAIAGRHGSQGQTGNTMGSTANMLNSTNPTAVSLQNSTAAGVLLGLGGQIPVSPTLTAGADGILCSFQNPVPTSAIPGKTLYIKGVRIHGLVTTAFTGGPVYYAYALAYGHNAISLATSESSTTKAPRRIPIGFESYPVTSAAGQLGGAAPLDIKFTAPIAVNAGEYVQVAAKNLGTVTSAGVITILVSFDAYFE